MNRRGFLQGLAALTVAGAVPAPVFKRWLDDAVIVGERFVLHEPLHIHGKYGVIIHSCYFELAADFVGDAALVLTDCEQVTIVECTITDPHSRMGDYGAYVSTVPVTIQS